MWRYVGVFLVLIIVGCLLGCPQRKDDTGTPVAREGGREFVAEVLPGTPEAELDEALADEEEAAEELPAADDDSQQPEEDEEEDAETGAESSPPGGLEAVAEVDADAQLAGEEDTPGDDMADAPVEDDMGDEPQPGVLDPGRVMGSAARVRSERPQARVSEESVAFAGQWDVVVLAQDGRAALVEPGDSWSFILGDGGSCTIQQRSGGDVWEQSGGWELVGGELSLMLGPGGRRAYGVSRHGENFAVLLDGEAGAVLFIVRDDGDGPQPKVHRSYDTDFGELRLRASGQQYYKGTYGEPEGTLLLRRLSGFLAGTWEQAPAQGFVVIELWDDSFSGWWWYEASTSVDGEWRGSAD